MIQLTATNCTVKIEAGELISFQANGHEYIHQKGSPGWRSSDTEMFPIIGPTGEADFRVKTPRGSAIQDQHGLLRELTYELIAQTDTSAVFQKEYRAGTLVNNSKFPKKSTKPQLMWPYDFKFTKSFTLKDGELKITFAVSGKEGMPYMLGYHPAFKLRVEKPVIQANDQDVSLAEVLAVGSRAFLVPDCEAITLIDEKELVITTEGFGHFMLWTEVPNMVCIEPITFYPYQASQQDLHTGFQRLGRMEEVYTVKISVSSMK